MDTGQFQDIVDRFIELDSARTGEIGDSILAGFAWIQDTKVIFLAEAADEDYQPYYDHHPCDWHRFSRLVNVSAQLKRPVLLWNLLFQMPAFAEQNLSLAMHHAIQSSELQLLKLPLPIIGVFDAPHYEHTLRPEFALVDGIILVGTYNKAEYAHMFPRVKIVSAREGIKKGILDLLADVSTISGETLIAERFSRLQQIVEQREIVEQSD
jgi:acetyl-CoA carboxylase alpha subunit